MRLLRFEVEGFRNLIRRAVMEELGPLNVIHGENNVGKSNLLAAIDLFFRVLHYRSDEGFELPLAGSIRLQTEVFGALAEGGSEVFNLASPRPVKLTGTIEIAPIDFARAGMDEVPAALPASISVELITVPGGVGSRISHIEYQGVPIPLEDHATAKTWKTLVGLICRNFSVNNHGPTFALLNTRRRVQAVVQPKEDETSLRKVIASERKVIASELSLKLYDMKESSSRAEALRWKLFKEGLESFRDVLGKGEVIVTYNRKSEQAVLALDGPDARVPIEIMGSGIQQIAALLGTALTSSASIIAIEEPELHLRFTIQKRLAMALRAIVSSGEGPTQLIVSSHSPAFETDQEFYGMALGPNGPELRRRPPSEAKMFLDYDTGIEEPRGLAPLSFLTSEGIVQVPMSVREKLGLQHGGGVTFVTNRDGHFEMLNQRQFFAALGGEANDRDGD